MATKEVKHRAIITQYTDDTVDYEFEGAETWPLGKMTALIERAGRFLREKQVRIRFQSQKEKAERDRIQADKDAKVAKLQLQANAIASRIQKDGGQTPGLLESLVGSNENIKSEDNQTKSKVSSKQPQTKAKVKRYAS